MKQSSKEVTEQINLDLAMIDYELKNYDVALYGLEPKITLLEKKQTILNFQKLPENARPNYYAIFNAPF